MRFKREYLMRLTSRVRHRVRAAVQPTRAGRSENMYCKWILLVLPVAIAWKINSRFISDYFNFKHVRFISILHCDFHGSHILATNIMKSKNVQSLYITKNITNIELKTHLHQWFVPIGVLLDLDCVYSKNILNAISQLRLFDSAHAWLALTSNKQVQPNNVTEDLISQSFANLNLSVDADIAVAIFEGGNYKLYDVFNFGRIQNNPLEIKFLGEWSHESGLSVILNGFKYYHRWDFHNLTLRAISVILGNKTDQFTPDVLTDPRYTDGVSAMTKITSTILNVLKEKHNFRFNYTIADRWVGSPKINSSLSVTNSMHWKQQDVSSTCLRIFSSWLDWMDPFFPPATFLETKFYYRIPNTGIGDYENRFIQPLSPTVWRCSVAALAVVAAILFLGAHVEARATPLSYAVFTVTAAACQQDFEDGDQTADNTSQGRRLVLFVAGTSTMLLYNYYTSSVVSWLLNAAPPSIANIDGLMDSSLELVFEDIGYTRSWLESPGFFYYSGFPWAKEDELRERKVKNGKRMVDLLQTADNGIALVQRGGFAYHTEPYNANLRIGRTFDQQMLCELGALQMMPPSPVFMVGQRRSPYKQFFTWSMIRAAERGHISYARRRIAGEAPRCSGGIPRALSLGQAAPAFAVLAYGHLLAMGIMLTEIFMSKYYTYFFRHRLNY